MRCFYLFLLFLCLGSVLFTGSAFSQTEYALPGTTWVYLNSPDHTMVERRISTVVGDTIMDGIACKVVHNELFSDFTGLTTGLYDDYYYTSGDSVFKYSEDYGRFILLMRFDVSAGDTLYYPIPDFTFSSMYPAPADSLYAVVVDSVVMVELAAGDWVRRVYTHPWMRFGDFETLDQYANYYFHHSDWWDMEGKGYYTERMGINQYLLSELQSALPTVEKNYDLICFYEDNLLKYQKINMSAGCSPTMAIRGMEDFQTIALFPNPVSSVINIELRAHSEIQSAQISGVDGRLLPVRWLSKSQICTQNLAPGIYHIQITDKKGRRVAASFTKL